MRVSKLICSFLLAGLLGLIILPALPASAEVAVDPSSTASAAAHGDGPAASGGAAHATSWIDDLGDGIESLWDYLVSVVVGGRPGGKTPGSEIDPDGHKAF